MRSLQGRNWKLSDQLAVGKNEEGERNVWLGLNDLSKVTHNQSVSEPSNFDVFLQTCLSALNSLETT